MTTANPLERFTPQDPGFAARVDVSFGRQRAMQPIGALLATVELRINFMAPAREGLLVTRGEIVTPGRTLSDTSGEVCLRQAGRSVLVAAMRQTLTMRPDTPDTPE